jgi:hypothetical protein
LRRTAPFLALLAIACSPEAPIPDHDLAVWVRHPDTEVAFGAPFPITVVRVWDRDLAPHAWDDGALAPLRVVLETVARREDGRRVEETRRFRAYAFDRESVSVAPLSFLATPPTGGPARVATSPGVELRVRPLLDPASPGAIEIPAAFGQPPSGLWLWPAIVAAVVVLGAASFVAARRGRRLPAIDAPRASSPRDRSLARLQALRRAAPQSSEDVEAWCIEAAAILRDDLADVSAVRAREMTTEEILAAPETRRLAGERLHAVRAVLAPCDHAKFGRHWPPAPERAVIVEALATLLETPFASRTEPAS